MTFDIHAAIADIDTRLGGTRTTIELAIERCPELAEGLRAIADIVKEVDRHGSPADLEARKRDADEEARLLYDVVDEAEARFAQIRDMALTLGRFDKAEGVQSEIYALAEKADAGQDYCMKRKDA